MMREECREEGRLEADGIRFDSGRKKRGYCIKEGRHINVFFTDITICFNDGREN